QPSTCRVSLVGKGRPTNAPVAANAALRRTSSSEEMLMSSERTHRRMFCKDWGSGQPTVFSHGWPLSANDWDAQMMFFLGRGCRVITHDRRGHGRSAQVADGHDMNHYADVKPRINKGRSRAASGPCSEPACYGHCYPLRPAWRPALISRTPRAAD